MKKILVLCFILLLGCAKTPPEFYLLKTHTIELKAHLNALESEQDSLNVKIEKMQKRNEQANQLILQHTRLINYLLEK